MVKIRGFRRRCSSFPANVSARAASGARPVATAQRLRSPGPDVKSAVHAQEVLSRRVFRVVCLPDCPWGGLGWTAAGRPEATPDPGHRHARGRVHRHFLERPGAGVFARRRLRVSSGQQSAVPHRARSAGHHPCPHARQPDEARDPVRAGSGRAARALERAQPHARRGIRADRNRNGSDRQSVRTVYRGHSVGTGRITVSPEEGTALRGPGVRPAPASRCCSSRSGL